MIIKNWIESKRKGEGKCEGRYIRRVERLCVYVCIYVCVIEDEYIHTHAKVKENAKEYADRDDEAEQEWRWIWMIMMMMLYMKLFSSMCFWPIRIIHVVDPSFFYEYPFSNTNKLVGNTVNLCHSMSFSLDKVMSLSFYFRNKISTFLLHF